MSTRASIAGHPVHVMLVNLPIGLWVFSLICDFAYVGTGDARWAITAYFTLGGGVVGALAAAVPGLIDLLGLRDPRATRVGMYHLVLNLSIVAAQALNFWLRMEDGGDVAVLPRAISIVAVAALTISGWLGWHLVHVFGVTQPGHADEVAPRHRDEPHPRT
jgi:uncharacterized membrane protein